MKWAVGFVLALAVCSTTACSQGRACTLIAAAPGIEVSVDPALDVTGGTLELCWDGRCRTERVELVSSTDATFVQVLGLPETAVTATVRLTGQSGAPVVDRTLTVTPELTYPNGPDCDGEAPQQQLVVDANGGVRVG